MTTNSDSKPTQSPNRQRFLLPRWLYFALVVVAFFGIAYAVYEQVRSSAIRERLTGQWKIDLTLDDGSVETRILDFRADGTIRQYPPGKAPPETGQINRFDWRWRITGGDLVIIYQTHFSPSDSPRKTAERFGKLIVDRANGKTYPLVFSDRYAIHDDGGDTINFTLQPGSTTQPAKFTIERLQADQSSDLP